MLKGSYVYELAYQCAAGLMRTDNQDNLLALDAILPPEGPRPLRALQVRGTTERLRCFGVFDGLGGEQYGQFASYEAASALKSAMAALPPDRLPGEETLNRLFAGMQRQVLDMADALGASSVGTTAVLALLQGTSLLVANLGDSRAYLYRNRSLRQLSRDHVSAPRGGGMPPSLTQYLGLRGGLRLAPHWARETLLPGDLLLLCSDGFSGAWTDAELAALLDEPPAAPLNVWTENLMTEAMVADGHDNLTLMLCRIAERSGEDGL